MGRGGRTYVMERVIKYDNLGPAAFLSDHHNKTYTKEQKQQTVCNYLDGERSYKFIVNQYGLRSKRQVQISAKKYTGHEELKEYYPQPEVYRMSSKKKTTKEERIEIVQHCLHHSKDYEGIATEYECNYNQIIRWIRKYLSKGKDGLNDKRGIHKADNELDETERLQRQVRILKAKLRKLELENKLLKLQEVEGRRHSPKDGSHKSYSHQEMQ